MNHLNRKVTIVALIACCSWAPLGQAEETDKVKVDPSGTWRWVFEANGNNIASAVKLNAQKDGKVTGVLIANDREIAISDGKIKGNHLSLRVQFEMQSRDVSGVLEGKIKGDEVDGSIEFKTEQGGQQFPWKAERTVEASDLVGDWNIVIDSPEGELESKLAITNVEGELKVMVTSQDGSKTTATNVKIEKKHLHYDLKLDYNGSDLTIKTTGRPYGSRITGSIEYSVNGDEGTLTFEGKRKKPEQPEKS